MHRRLLLGSIVSAMLCSTAVMGQSQQPPNPPFDPDPRLVNVKMIVVSHVGVVSEDRGLLTSALDTIASRTKVAEFMASRFEAEGHPVTVADRNPNPLPEGMHDLDVLYVRFRLDLSASRLANDSEIVVGTVSTYFQRGEDGLPSRLPMTHFVLEGDRSVLRERTEQALFEQAQKGVVDQLVYLKKRGF